MFLTIGEVTIGLAHVRRVHLYAGRRRNQVCIELTTGDGFTEEVFEDIQAEALRRYFRGGVDAIEGHGSGFQPHVEVLRIGE